MHLHHARGLCNTSSGPSCGASCRMLSATLSTSSACLVTHLAALALVRLCSQLDPADGPLSHAGRLCRCLGPEAERPSAQELLHDSFFLRRLGKGDSAKSMVAMLPASTPALTPRNSRRSETEGSDAAIHCQVCCRVHTSLHGKRLCRLPCWAADS